MKHSILFVCHGNICRSPMAEFVMKDLVAVLVSQHRQGRQGFRTAIPNGHLTLFAEHIHSSLVCGSWKLSVSCDATAAGCR